MSTEAYFFRDVPLAPKLGPRANGWAELERLSGTQLVDRIEDTLGSFPSDLPTSVYRANFVDVRGLIAALLAQAPHGHQTFSWAHPFDRLRQSIFSTKPVPADLPPNPSRLQSLLAQFRWFVSQMIEGGGSFEDYCERIHRGTVTVQDQALYGRGVHRPLTPNQSYLGVGVEPISRPFDSPYCLLTVGPLSSVPAKGEPQWVFEGARPAQPAPDWTLVASLR